MTKENVSWISAQPIWWRIEERIKSIEVGKVVSAWILQNKRNFTVATGAGTRGWDRVRSRVVCVARKKRCFGGKLDGGYV